MKSAGDALIHLFRARRGNSLCRDLQPALYGYLLLCQAFCARFQEARDITAETFVKLLETARQLRQYS